MLDWLNSTYQNVAKRLASGQLHHGLIFHGKAGTGKNELCLALAKLLLCKATKGEQPCHQCQSCKLFVADNHPDLIQIPVEKSIGVDAVREAIGRLLHTSQLGGNKVLFIEHAHLMTTAAANALLKTLEEPTQHTYILMTCPSLHELLPTVLSRCEKHAVNVSDKASVQTWLETSDIDVNPDLFELYWQSPLFLKEQLDDSTNAILDALQQIGSGNENVELPSSLFEKPELVINWIQHWVQKKTQNSVTHPEMLEQLLSFSGELQRYKFRCAQQGANKRLQLSLCMSDFSKISAANL